MSTLAPAVIMEKTLKQLCEEHRLTTISVMLVPAEEFPPFTVYVHWDNRECASGSGDTVVSALAIALAEMAERRDREVSS